MLSLASFVFLMGSLVLASLVNPATAFAAVLCLFGIKQWGQSTTQVFAYQLPTFVNYVVGVIVLVGAARQWRNDQGFSNRYGAVWILVSILYLYAYLSSFWAPVPIMSPRIIVMQWIAWFPYVLTIAIFSPLLINKIDDVTNFAKWTIYIGGLTCALALFFGRWGYRGLLIEGISRADVWNETNPLAMATLGGTVAICGFLMSLHEEVRLKKYLFLLVIPIGVAVIIRSGSRGQLVSLFLALLIGVPALLKRSSGSGVRNLIIGLGVVILLTDLIFTQGLIGGDYQVMASRWSLAETTEAASGRVDMLKVLLEQAGGNIFSVIAGIGNSGSFSLFDIYTHIAPLEIFAEEGLIGFSIYVAILILTFINFMKLMNASNNMLDRRLHQALSVLWILFLFEFFLSAKQGTLLSSIYVFAYAAMLDRLVNRLETEKQPVQEEGESLQFPHKPDNLMA